MSKNLNRYWQIEYQLQHLWSIPHEARDYSYISVLNAEQSKVIQSLREEERKTLEDSVLSHKWFVRLNVTNQTICHSNHAKRWGGSPPSLRKLRSTLRYGWPRQVRARYTPRNFPRNKNPPEKRYPEKNRQKNLTDLEVMCYNGYMKTKGSNIAHESYQEITQRLISSTK